MKDFRASVTARCQEFTRSNDVAISENAVLLITDFFQCVSQDYGLVLDRTLRADGPWIDPLSPERMETVLDRFVQLLPLYLAIIAGKTDASSLRSEIRLPDQYSYRVDSVAENWKAYLACYETPLAEIGSYDVLQFLRLWLPYIMATCWPFRQTGAND